ncbi:MAG: NAD(P)H-hydrate dehydratase [Proteobacteria bacterium]|nr:NAD(P)H-hydrate dehydratase [Pseudomonadota bacterium]
MQRIDPDRIPVPLPLFGTPTTRRLEQAAAATLPPHTLMQRAGLAVARLAMAIAPHARTVWVACGPGNNGGDGFEAALHLQQRGYAPTVTWIGDPSRLPTDALASLRRAQAAGVAIADEPPAMPDLVIDALLGLGSTRAPEGRMTQWLQRMHEGAVPVLAVDLPSGLDADTGRHAMDFIAGSARPAGAAARFCLSLLTLKPGLFTAEGRDWAGEVWFEDLGCGPAQGIAADAELAATPADPPRAHASHKGSYGDVAVLGGAPGMAGAAVLAATAALHAGAGRVFVGLLGAEVAWDSTQPELMFRAAGSLPVPGQTLVCGCGGGEAVRAVLPRALAHAGPLVLDADALNALAGDAQLQALVAAREAATVMTPHPLEAARLLGSDTRGVQADRLAAAQTLAERNRCTVVLKGSGSVVAHPGARPSINPTGNAWLATAGTGDVLAGMVGAALAEGRPPREAAIAAVWHHGALADRWPTDRPLTASALARRGA